MNNPYVIKNYSFKGIPLENVQINIDTAIYQPALKRIDAVLELRAEGSEQAFDTRRISFEVETAPDIVGLIESKIAEDPSLITE